MQQIDNSLHLKSIRHDLKIYIFIIKKNNRINTFIKL